MIQDLLSDEGLYYDMDGNPMTLAEWRRAFEDTPNRILAKTPLPGGLEVSTVWLGLNHAYGGGPPLIFETLVFPECSHMERYSTKAQALAGHARVVEELKRSIA